MSRDAAEHPAGRVGVRLGHAGRTHFDRGVDNLVDTLRGVTAADPNAFLNVVITDGARVLGVTWATG